MFSVMNLAETVGPLPENQGDCLPAVPECSLCSVSLEGRRCMGRAHPAAALDSTWVDMPPACLLACLSLAAVGRILACVPLFHAIQPHLSFPAAAFSGQRTPGLLVSCSLGGAAGAEGSQRTQRNPSLSSFLLYTKGLAKEGWLLTWRGCYSHLIPLADTSLGDRR